MKKRHQVTKVPCFTGEDKAEYPISDSDFYVLQEIQSYLHQTD